MFTIMRSIDVSINILFLTSKFSIRIYKYIWPINENSSVNANDSAKHFTTPTDTPTKSKRKKTEKQQQQQQATSRKLLEQNSKKKKKKTARVCVQYLFLTLLWYFMR